MNTNNASIVTKIIDVYTITCDYYTYCIYYSILYPHCLPLSPRQHHVTRVFQLIDDIDVCFCYRIF